MAKNKTRGLSLSIDGENVVGIINASASARVNLDQKIIQQASPEMTDLFKRVRRKVKSRRSDPRGDQAKLEHQVKKIEAEAAKGSKADPDKLERWIRTLAKMAPDIVEVMAASLAGPAAGFTMVFKKIVERAQATTAGP